MLSWSGQGPLLALFSGSNFRAFSSVDFINKYQLTLYLHSKGLITISHSDMKYSYCIVLIVLLRMLMHLIDSVKFTPTFKRLSWSMTSPGTAPSPSNRPCWYDGNCVRLIIALLRLESATGQTNCTNCVNKGVAVCVF